MLYTLTTNKKIQTVKKIVDSCAKELGFGVLKEYEFQEILQSKGHPIDKDITVFELCNPVLAQSALTLHPEMSVYLPCRISIYEIAGKTTISTIGLEDIINSFELEDKFKVDMQEIFAKLKQIISNLAE